MNKKVVIHQPDFLPYLGFFHKLLKADLWVILDHVQFLNNSKSWHNRDKIKTPQGEKWISVSVKKCPQKTPINQVLLSDIPWRGNNLNLIKQNYYKAQYYNEIFPHLENLYDFQCNRMIDFNLASIEMILNLFDIKVTKILSSSLNPSGQKNELLVDLLKKVNANIYLSGLGARAYFSPEPYDEAKICVEFQNFMHPIYSQLHGEFIPYLSSIDMFFNCGIEKSRKILREI